MRINEIGVEVESEVVDLNAFRDAPDPKSRESMTTILADALASADAAPAPEAPPATVVPLSATAVEPPAAGDVGHAA